MKVKILGTAAAEGIPALFCVCPVCRAARDQGGRDVRRRAAYLWDEDILIDLGPDLFFAQVTWNLDYSKLRHVLITHTHADHFHPTNLYYRRPGFAKLPGESWLTVHGNARVGEGLAATLEGAPERSFLDYAEASVGELVALGAGRTALPLRASHGEDETCLNYLLQEGEGKILIGNDSGWWSEETWALLSEHRVDVALLDCTYGASNSRQGHMGITAVIEAGAELRKLGTIGDGTRLIATHFSHNGGLTHDQLVAALAPAGIEAAYDGLEIEI